MDELTWIADPPALRSPALVCAFRGWNDAGSAATTAVLIASVAHSMPVPVTGMASDPEMVERLGLSRSNYEGPTGIVGVLHDACRRKGMTSASLWAAVPHYVAASPNPKAALALLRRLEGLVGIALEASELAEAADRDERQLDRAA